VKVALLVNDLALSGGIGVVVEHARQLATHHQQRPRAMPPSQGRGADPDDTR